jgi:DNA replication ATP-dependent helicase Dna2
VMLTRSRRDGAELGIFQALKAHESSGTRLDVTYRLNDKLTEWPSENFYHGELMAADLAARRRLGLGARGAMPDWIRAALEPESPLIRIESGQEGARTSNAEEAGDVAELIRAMTSSGMDLKDIAVVTPYRKQARQIRRRLQTLAKGEPVRACVIDTVERMQGQEREVILLSLCASDPGFIQEQALFLFDPHRLNVAVTRARTKLILFCSETMLTTDLYDSELGEEQALLKDLKTRATLVKN